MLKSLSYQVQVRPCQSSACVDFFTFDASCAMTLQVNNATTSATARAEDCAAFKQWMTRDALLAGLAQGGIPCPENGPTDESFEVDLSNGTTAKRKTEQCPGEPWDSARACIAELRRRYF